jgi:hypothetical protein
MDFCTHQFKSAPKIKKPHEINGAAHRILSREECRQLGAAGILADGHFLKADYSGGTAAEFHGLPPNRSAPAESEIEVYACN